MQRLCEHHTRVAHISISLKRVGGPGLDSETWDCTPPPSKSAETPILAYAKSPMHALKSDRSLKVAKCQPKWPEGHISLGLRQTAHCTRRRRSRTFPRFSGLSVACLTCATSPASLQLCLRSAGVRRRGLHRWPTAHRTGCGCGELRRQLPRSAPFHRDFDPPPNGQRARFPGLRCVRLCKRWRPFDLRYL